MLLLVTGHPRSGTTILQQLCDRHPALSITNEFGSLAYLDQPFPAHAKSMLKRWQAVEGRWPYHKSLADPARKKYRKRLNLLFTLRYLSALLCGGVGTVTSSRVHRAYTRLFREAAIVGDKLPGYLYSIEKFTGIEQMKRVVIYRDCRDVVSSFLVKVRSDWNKMEWAQRVDTPEKIAARWVEGIERMERHADALFLIRYESLVAQPHAELSRLADYLGVEVAGFEPDMVLRDKTGKHRQGLTGDELERVMAVAGATMDRLGYLG